jgi:hypothetical protein
MTFSVAEVAAFLEMSPQSVRRLFEKEPGIIVLARPGRMNKRRYRSMRIPRAVYNRVTGRLTQ